jgi:hypothetical protein
MDLPKRGGDGTFPLQIVFLEPLFIVVVVVVVVAAATKVLTTTTAAAVAATFTDGR